MTGALRIALSAVALVGLAACPRPAPVRAVEPSTAAPAPPIAPAPVEPRITWARVTSPADVPATPPPAGTWRIHLLDVGTGLAILVQGHDFTLLYDAGTNDPSERPERVIAYLRAALGRSGDALCGGDDTVRRTIDHVVLSHPHLDHASALDLVLHCYDVRHVWDSGRVHHAVFYRDFVTAVARAAGATYHTAAPVDDDRTVTIKEIDVTIPDEVAWETFSEGDVVELGAAARFTLLHAEAKAHRDPNRNSIVLAVDLGDTRLLLVGDAESGPRADPAAALGDVEAHLVDQAAAAIDADILQVGHHGSKTSSRRAFLDAVSPSLALISTGPKSYRGTTLPDPEVIAALEAIGATILRTDIHDAACDLAERIGPPTGPGGCDHHIITVEQTPARR